MNEPRKIGDMVVRAGIPELEAYLRAVANEFHSLIVWMRLNIGRDSEADALNNILICAHSYILGAAKNLEGHISFLALISRNMYELMLRVRDIAENPGGLGIWEAEAFTDHIELMEALLKLEETAGVAEARDDVRAQIADRRAYMLKHGITSKRVEAAADVAKRVGKKNDHEVFFKFLSKLVHPTSFLVNGPTLAGGEENRGILQIYLQICTWDVYCNVQRKYGAPEPSKEVGEFWSRHKSNYAFKRIAD